MAEGGPARFREDLLSETLQLAGRRRRVRQVRRATAILAVLSLLGAFAWRILVRGNPTITPSAESYHLVRTIPLPGSAMIATQAFRGERALAPFGTVTVVRTTPDGKRPRAINDDTLLALVAPRRAVLVRMGTGSEKLIFVKPDGRSEAGVD
jgi:hypothetical protein